MANARHGAYGMLGVLIDERTTSPKHEKNTTTRGVDNTAYVYGQASETVTGTCTVDANGDITDAAGNFTADVAFASGEYGWVRQTALDVA